LLAAKRFQLKRDEDKNTLILLTI